MMETKTCLEYVWIDGIGSLRSKIRVCIGDIDKLASIEKWNYDGSSTNQATGHESEIILKPCAIFNDAFDRNTQFIKYKLVMCDTYLPDGTPAINNNRKIANDVFNKYKNEIPWFGLEQEYFMIDSKTNLPLGFPDDNNIGQGQYYCSVGRNNAFGRQLAEEHMKRCLQAGITISGINAEVAPGQWEFQVGPCLGISQGDHLWMARYILYKIAEKYDIIIDLEPKPIKGSWNGSGCHVNFSTDKMRQKMTNGKTGLEYINEAIEKLSKKHVEHMEVYGVNNHLRMTGEHETASYDKFTDSIANRGCSIRRGNNTVVDKCGYFEDRRPSSNCDPYIVTSIIMKTTTE